MKEIDVLIEQLEELLHEPIVDGEDALEVAVVAGLAARLGAPASALEESLAWRNDEGESLLESGFSAVDLEALVGEVDSLVGEEEETVEEALSDFDDVVAAALWCGKNDWVRSSAVQVARSIRQVPETFGFLSKMGSAIAALPVVGQNLDIYDYWLAVAESSQWIEKDSS